MADVRADLAALPAQWAAHRAAAELPPPTDPQTLASIEQLLLPQLGPMALLVVRDAARRHADPAALIAWLAADVLEPEEREQFLLRARRLVPCAAPVGRPAPSGALPVLGTTPMQPELVEKAQHVLAELIGPIAAVLARRAAATAPTREVFFAALADAAGPEIDRKALLAQLWKLR